MFSRSVFVAFLSLALSVQALPQGHQQCPAAQTETQLRTVTVTARAAAPTLIQNGGSTDGNTKPTSSSRAAVTAVSSAKAAATTPARGGNKNTAVAATSAARGNNNNGKGTKTTSDAATATQPGNGGGGKNNKTSSAAAAATSIAAENNGGKNNGNPQKSTTLDPRVIASGFANNGQDVPTAGQVASLTSTNNFINFCLTVPNLPITNGKQITTGSCNPAPIGVIPSIDNMPSSKFTFPPNFGTIKAGQTFTIEMAIKNMQAGFFVNAQANYFAAPQQLNSKGQIQGHSHVVVEQLSALDQTTPTDPKKFTFFKGLNAAAQGGKLTADVPDGLQPGFYKLSSINTASNHQPVIVPVAQHGSLDDAIYFTVTADGKPLAGAAGGKNSPSVKAATSSPVSAATGKAASSSASAALPTDAPRTGNTGKKNAGNAPSASVSSAPKASPTAATKGGRRRRALSRMA